MFPNPIDCEAAVARTRDLVLEAQRAQTLRAVQGTGVSSSPPTGRQRLGAILIRVGRRIEGAEAASPARAGAVSRA